MHVVRQAFQRNVLAQTAHLLPPRKLRPHFLRLDSRVHPGDKKVIKHVGAFGDEAGMIPGHRFDQAFDKFFAELLNHLGGALGKEPRRMAYRCVDPLPAVDDCPEPIEHLGTGRKTGCVKKQTIRRILPVGILVPCGGDLSF